MITYPLILQTIASLTGIATSTSMIIAYRQLKLATRNSQLTFEDALAREYRQIGSRVPLRAVLGEDLSDAAIEAALPEFFWYFDLSNQQVFLRRNDRVSDLAWGVWAEGIRANMARPAFAKAWRTIAEAQPSLFADLRWFLAQADGVRDDRSRPADAAGAARGRGGSAAA
ncbi:MAG TPA: hypothetical protein VEB22_13020 [Phycisphaerales bacterium]|nr:hypothetical protein [Phycisphaerales bacterium]